MKSKFKSIWLIELLIGIALVLSLLGFQEVGEDLLLPNSIAWIPFTAYGLLLVGLIVEYKLGNRPIIRIIMFSIFLAAGLICLTESYGFASITLSVTGIPYLISLIVVNIKGMPGTIQPKIKKEDVLPVGVLSKKEIYVQYISWAIMIVLIVALVVVLNALQLNYLYALTIPVILIPYSIVVYKVSPLIHILKEINKNMDYESFEQKIDEVLKTNIHPETYNYLLIVKVNYLYSYDLKRALELFSSIQKPENKKYLTLYEFVQVEGLIHLGQFEEAYQKIQNSNEGIKPKLMYFYQVFCTTEEIQNLETIYPTNQKINFSNASSLYTKMFYYNSRGDLIKAKELAQQLIEYAPNLKFFKTEAEKITSIIES